MARKTEADFFNLLRVSPAGSPQQRAGWLQARIAGLGCGPRCTRCGGTGNCSFNMIDGTRCYGCQGTGYGYAKLTDKLYAQLAGKVDAGELDAYLDDLRERQALQRQFKSALETVMQAWTAARLGGHYDWTKAAKGVQPDKRIADEVNKPMCDAYGATREAVDAAESLSHRLRRAKDAAEREHLNLEWAGAMRRAVEARDEALAVIANGRQRLTVLLAGKDV